MPFPISTHEVECYIQGRSIRGGRVVMSTNSPVKFGLWLLCRGKGSLRALVFTAKLKRLAGRRRDRI
ncbi:hypothetical protein C0J52_00472 [Blattella germanica]|nr:hypothetical protein C0J52_00472 [Blattella germanica]